mgnify:CR=1 FL=1
MSGSNAKISVITVCYQAVKTIAATIQSVLEQTDADMEYVIVDGGSTDGTLDRIRAVSDSRIQLISERDQGIYDAMNKGVRLCRGEYGIFINGVDLFADREVLHTAAQAMGREKPDILYGDYLNMYEDHCALVDNGKEKIGSWYFLMSKMICHQAIFAKRELLLRYPFDVRYRYAADRKWLITCVKNGASLKHLPVPVSYYDRRGVSSDEGNFEAVRREIDLCLQEEYPVRGRLLMLVKRNKKLREWIRGRIFKKQL